MNPAGSYEMPVKYFLESNEYDIQTVDASKTEYFRMIRNGGEVHPNLVLPGFSDSSREMQR
jgi:hypothetical protein